MTSTHLNFDGLMVLGWHRCMAGVLEQLRPWSMALVESFEPQQQASSQCTVHYTGAEEPRRGTNLRSG